MRRPALILFFCAAAITISPAQTVTKLVDFTGSNGSTPVGSLMQGTDGNFYGTTSAGGISKSYCGSNGCGTIFKMTPQGELTTFYQFCSQFQSNQCRDGIQPLAGLVQGIDGNFYGATRAGGAGDVGTVFRITLQGTLTTLYSFCTGKGTCRDGNWPQGLVQGPDGSFYGVTSQGGVQDHGTIFKITPDGIFTSLYTFCTSLQSPCPDGSYPNGPLVFGNDGDLYGTTLHGGNADDGDAGTIFKVTASGQLTQIYSFNGAGGAYPEAGLVQGTDGNFYGTAAFGANNSNSYGTVFQVTPNGSLTVLYSFCSQDACTDGFALEAPVMQATDGNFYGTTFYGGDQSSDGTIFKVTSQGAFSTLHAFNGDDGSNPQSGLVQGTDGAFYGLTTAGGAYGQGTVFKLELQLNLTLQVSRIGNGSVTSGDNKINCGSVCYADYNFDDVVTLTATPSQGWQFADWRGCDNVQENVCTVTIHNARNVTASFIALPVALTVSLSGSGLVSSGDNYIYCGNTCSHMYVLGTQVGMTAIPAAGFTLDNWDGCDNVQGNFCWVTMSAAKDVTATFTVAPVNLVSLTLKPSSVRGGMLAAATLTLSAPAPGGGVGVLITSDHPQVAHPPAFVVVPGGMSSVIFAVHTFPVKMKTDVTITGTAGSSQVSGILSVGTSYSQPTVMLGSNSRSSNELGTPLKVDAGSAIPNNVSSSSIGDAPTKPVNRARQNKQSADQPRRSNSVRPTKPREDALE